MKQFSARRRLRAGLLALPTALLMIFGLAACGGDADGSSDSLRQVTVGIGIRTPTATQAMETYLPIALGYWEEEGLDVKIQGFDGTGASVQALVTGNVDVANSTGTNTVATSNLTAGTDLRCFVVGVTHGYQRIVRMPESTDIKGIADLAGKKVGVLSLESSQYNWVVAALVDAGVDPKTVEFIATGQGPEAVEALRKRQIDALVAYDGAALAANASVGAVQVPSEYLESIGFNTCMTVEAEKLDADPDLYVGLARGYIKSIIFAKENPEAAVKAFWDEYPDGRPTGDLDKALDGAVTQLKARLENMQPLGDVWGAVDDSTVKGQVEALVRGGGLSEAVPVEKLWTDKLIDKINDFDIEKVREDARTWKKERAAAPATT